MSLRIIKVTDLDYYKNKQNVLIVDIRGKGQYDKDHILGAMHVPLEKLESFLKLKSKNQLVILYCERGITSVREANRYSKLGYTMGTLAGGYAAYQHWRNSK